MTVKIDEKNFKEVVAAADNMGVAAATLGLKFSTFVRYAKKFGVYAPNPAKWSGKGTKKPKKFGRDSFSLEDILNGVYPHYSSHKLRVRLLATGLKENKCEECGIEEWNGKKISMHLDHIDGNHLDHRLENLRILCPNCHSQTPTFGSKKMTWQKNMPM